ncbi:ABC transporter substrate-binding protein [Miltoncostaea oceani]|jgi:polar amino acid transport system substrate-binding protein|uniref:ABC transporter substrate-binding protein n=1 Tax=Miltoncostaea oceani TaxID=2843216 RepID=UPI001C3C62BC|nr:ABC transporter substrate-binding protein [Miltoncostaea oceani]
MRRARRLIAALALVAVASVALAACGDDDDTSAASTAATTATACERSDLDLVADDTLTIGTDSPAFPPYFVDDDPTNGEGFESAVAYAIAAGLGFAPDEVTWAVVPFNSSYAPGPKDFDFDINQISITPERAGQVDFSEPYYTTPQAVLVAAGSDYAGATSVAELKDAKIGVQVGTTSLDAVTSVIGPSSEPQVFNDSNDTVRALKNGQVDAIVTDLPTAIYLRDVEIEGSEVVGQFSAPGGDDWGVVLAKDSALTPCVSSAVSALRESGELAAITEQWIGAEAPELDLE